MQRHQPEDRAPLFVPVADWAPAHTAREIRLSTTFEPHSLEVQPCLQFSDDGVNWTTETATFDR